LKLSASGVSAPVKLSTANMANTVNRYSATGEMNLARSPAM
jgi:hypothetical protein